MKKTISILVATILALCWCASSFGADGITWSDPQTMNGSMYMDATTVRVSKAIFYGNTNISLATGSNTAWIALVDGSGAVTRVMATGLTTTQQLINASQAVTRLMATLVIDSQAVTRVMATGLTSTQQTHATWLGLMDASQAVTRVQADGLTITQQLINVSQAVTRVQADGLTITQQLVNVSQAVTRVMADGLTITQQLVNASQAVTRAMAVGLTATNDGWTTTYTLSGVGKITNLNTEIAASNIITKGQANLNGPVLATGVGWYSNANTEVYVSNLIAKVGITSPSFTSVTTEWSNSLGQASISNITAYPGGLVQFFGTFTATSGVTVISNVSAEVYASNAIIKRILLQRLYADNMPSSVNSVETGEFYEDLTDGSTVKVKR